MKPVTDNVHVQEEEER